MQFLYGWGALIDNQPVQPNLADGFRELNEINRLADITVGPEIVASDQIRIFPRRCEDHGGKQSCSRVTANTA
jgi:hypothetical protein